ncbi:uncharacterized protein LOC143915357 isoform X2 [Arctopsyche grandis]|uniref:uncharacterized protein LOC143915357 isoform X2 n=1 Tax=Arctopsyche grandis TaxID=121162 RepID=UPI00406DA12E
MDLELLCRVCSITVCKEQMENIFCSEKEHSKDTSSLPLNIMILNVLPNDKLPPNVCKQCKNELVNAANIAKVCRESDQKFRRLISQIVSRDISDDKSLHIFNGKAELKSENNADGIFSSDLSLIENKHNGELFVKSEINISNEVQFVSKNILKYEKNSNVSFDENCESPPGRDLDFSSEEEVELIPKNKSLKVKELLTNVELNVCKICGVTLCSKSSLRAHQVTHSTERPFKCDKCELKFKLKSHLTDHRRNIHEGLKNHRCKTCNKLFYGSSQLKIHMMKHTKEYPHLCTQCGKRFAQQCYLKVHQKIHFGVKDLSCTHCDYVSGNRSALKMHIKGVHDVDKKHQCADCGLRFLYPSGLAGHMTTHTGVKRFQCSICQAKFRTNSSLKEHKRIHSDEKPYSCKYCDKSFRIITHRTVHERIHTGEKPYSCVVCDKKFQTKSNLNAHAKIHDRTL